MVTKQQQLEWLAVAWMAWNHSRDTVCMSKSLIGDFVSLIDANHCITRQEWQQEREKMQKHHDFDIGSNLKVSVAATSNGFGEMKINTLWPERGGVPPVGVPVELWFGGTFAYNCEFIAMRGNTYVVWNLDADKPDCADRMNSQFRPRHHTRTEREKVIDSVCLTIYENGANPLEREVIGKMYDAGLLD